MSTDRDVNRIVRSWLEEGVTALPDRVLDTVLDQLPATQQRRAWWPARRVPNVTSGFKLLIAAAGVVIVAIVGINLLPGRGAGPGSAATPSPAPSVTPSPSPPPSAALGPTRLPYSGPLAPATYVLGNPFPLEVSMDVPAGWAIWGAPSSAGAGIYKDSPDPPAGKAIVITIVEDVYADACDTSKGMIDLGPTANDLAMALANQAQTQASAISDVTLGGYSGKYVEYTFEGPTPDCPRLKRWQMSVGPREAIADEHDKVWIVDVDGVMLVIDAASFSGVSAADHAEMRAMVNSITITP